MAGHLRGCLVERKEEAMTTKRYRLNPNDEYKDADYTMSISADHIRIVPCLILGIIPGCFFTNYQVLYFDAWADEYVERTVAAPALVNKWREDRELC